MKLLNSFISRIGTDKVMHFLVGGWLTAQFTAYGIGMGIVGTVIIAGLEFAKEKWLDDTFDKKDLLATVSGCVLELVLCVFRLL